MGNRRKLLWAQFLVKKATEPSADILIYSLSDQQVALRNVTSLRKPVLKDARSNLADLGSDFNFKRAHNSEMGLHKIR